MPAVPPCQALPGGGHGLQLRLGTGLCVWVRVWVRVSVCTGLGRTRCTHGRAQCGTVPLAPGSSTHHTGVVGGQRSPSAGAVPHERAPQRGTNSG